MEKSRDSVIKLFGKTIQLPSVREVLATLGEDSVRNEKKALSNNQNNHEPNHKNEETRIYQQEESIDDQNISNTNEEKNKPMHKTLEKPDKILPCPRCKSMDTKFCYFNNYNVNQPRHFCKNCQRYWTEGGSMRNVPVGAGRRKTKSSITNHHHIAIPDCPQADLYEQISYPSPLKPNGTLISFDAEAPLWESMDSNGEDQLSRSLVPNPWSHTSFYQMYPYLGLPWLCSGVNYTVLGKHSREGNMLNNSNPWKDDHAKSEQLLWIPKTLRISEHEKAAKCSVWGKLGFNNDKADRVLKNRSAEASQVLCANPAALSRSISFQERS